MSAVWSLSGVKRTSELRAPTSEIDPNRKCDVGHCLLGSTFANLAGNPAEKRTITLLTDSELPRWTGVLSRNRTTGGPLLTNASGTDRPPRGCFARACIRSCRRAPDDRAARGFCDHQGSGSTARLLCRIATPRTASSRLSWPRPCAPSCAADRRRRGQSICAMSASSGLSGPS